jgi:CBS domain-containing protein
MAIGNQAQLAEEARGQTPWANRSIGDEPQGTIETLQKGLTVGLIATERANFETCTNDEMLSSVVERNRRNQFDFLPVVAAATDRIVGLIEIAPLMHGTSADGHVGAMMCPLAEENLIGADASILAFVRDADRHKCRLVVSGHKISGLVSLSDLQRLPVRAALFGLVTHLEIIMTNVIRREFSGTGGWLERIAEGRRNKLHDEIRQAQADDALVDPLLFTQFVDKVTIIRKSPHSIFGKGRFESELRKVQSLRDRLVHANDYAASPKAASETCETVRLIDKWSKSLSQWPSGVETSQK